MKDKEQFTNITTWLSHVRHELRNPINGIIGYSEIILEELEYHENAEHIKSDLEKINNCGRELLDLIKTLFDENEVELFDENEEENNIDIFNLQKVFFQLLTPINTIMGYCEILLENKTLHKFTSDLEKILLASEDLINKINHIFKLSVDTHQDLALESISLDQPPDISSEEILADREIITDVTTTVELLESNKYKKLKINEGNILVVDDNSMNRDLISRRLLNQGYQVNCAIDGKQAIKMIETGDYDLILLDIMMPELNGYQVLKYIKADETLRDLPVIMISALDEIDSIVRCIEMGAEDYLSKPFNPILLRARIGACLEKKRLRDKELIYLEKLAQTNEKLTIANQKLIDELNIAKQIQEAMLPKLSNIKDSFPYCELSASLESARAVGGDLYDFFLLNNGTRLCFLIGDVADKGVPAALFMARSITLIRSLVDDFDTPVSLLQKINSELCRDNDQFLFVTLLCGILNLETGIVEWASAGHNSPLLVSQLIGNVIFIPLETGMPLGIEAEAKFPLGRSQLQPEDTLVLYTDGVTEAHNHKNESFGEERLKQVLIPTQQYSAHQLISQVKKAVYEFVNQYEQWDDITLLSLKYQPSNNKARIIVREGE